MDGRDYEEAVTVLKHEHGIESICQNRKERTGQNSGGGVAILFRKSKITLKPFVFKKNNCEIVIAEGRFSDSRRSTYIIGVYIPPCLRKQQSDRYISTLRDAITKIKTKDRNPLIIVAGDLNKYNIGPVFQDFLDFSEVPSPPTRNGERLDKIFMNDFVTNVECFSSLPIENEAGVSSDHCVLNCSVTLTLNHDFEWISYKTQDMT